MMPRRMAKTETPTPMPICAPVGKADYDGDDGWVWLVWASPGFPVGFGEI